MSEIEKNIKISWQLVSQFVSWEFCRHMREENGLPKTEKDILNFLRNMIVKRTERAVIDLTKHEVVARLITEVASSRQMSEIAHINTLSENAKKICPELLSEIEKFVPLFSDLLTNLELAVDLENRQSIEQNISKIINSLIEKASVVLPVPDLPQVVAPWLDLSTENFSWIYRHKTKERIKIDKNTFLEAKEWLNEIKFTSTELKITEKNLSEDKNFQIMLLNPSKLDSILEEETQLSSQPILSFQPPVQNPLVQDSFQLSSQHSTHITMPDKSVPDTDSLGLDSQPGSPLVLHRPHLTAIAESPEDSNERFFDCDDPLSAEKHPHSSPPQIVSKAVKSRTFLQSSPPVLSRQPDPGHRTDEDVPPPRAIREGSPTGAARSQDSPFLLENYSQCSQASGVLDSQNSKLSPLKALQSRNQRRYLNFIQNVPDSSDEENVVTDLPIPSLHDLDNFETPDLGSLNTILCDSDSSDCDKHCQIRFLTPTIYKTNEPLQPRAKRTPAKPLQRNNILISDDDSNEPVAANHVPPSPRSSASSTSSSLPAKRRRKERLQVPDDSDLSTDLTSVDNRKQGPSYSSSNLTLSDFSDPFSRKRTLRSNTKSIKVQKKNVMKKSFPSNQSTLRRYVLPQANSNQNRGPGPIFAIKRKTVQLYNPDLVRLDPNESSLFRKALPIKKSNPGPSHQQQGAKRKLGKNPGDSGQKPNEKKQTWTKRKCQICCITFPSPRDLEKHNFLEH